jgi:hypothetical protein
MTTADVIAAAELHAPNAQMQSSAVLCLANARRELAAGHEPAARNWARRSLEYSVGVFSPVYDAARVSA